MTSLRITAALFTGVAVLSMTPTVADAKKRARMSIDEQIAANMLPPRGYNQRRWVAYNGCDYSRAGRPGETIWYVISNTRGRKKCEPVIVERAITDGAYTN